MKKLIQSLAFVGAAAICWVDSASAQDWYPYPVEVWNPPFDMASPRTTVDYVPLDKAEKAWDICVSFPHMKDAYWLAVDYGVVAESERLGVKMQLVEAGGYTNLNTQISQIEDCVARGAEAVVIGAISFDGMNNLVSEIRAKGIPVIDVINGISHPSYLRNHWSHLVRWDTRLVSTLPNCIRQGQERFKLLGFQDLREPVGSKRAIPVFRKLLRVQTLRLLKRSTAIRAKKFS